jgi:hypothetical protein
VPRFSKIARSYLLHIDRLDWKRINPDIFGSMIQAVAEDEERGALGMHYTSVPNILKVLNPLFLDELRAKLEEAADNQRMLLNLRNRLARIRVFDPACGSGNFLVIAYKEMRGVEAEINRRRGESDRRSDIPKTNFRGIELRDFPSEIARLALVIAEYQCDVLYRGHKLALADEVAFHPHDQNNHHEMFFTCDDLRTEMATLRNKGVRFGETAEERWGTRTTISLPGGGTIGLYEPKHPVTFGTRSKTRNVKRRNPRVKRGVKPAQLWTLWLKDLPAHPSIELGGTSDFILKVSRAKVRL